MSRAVDAEGFGVELEKTIYTPRDLGTSGHVGKTGAVVIIKTITPRAPNGNAQLHFCEDRLAQLGQAIQAYFAAKAVRGGG